MNAQGKIGKKGIVIINKDDRGSLKALNTIPFDVRRSFIITDVPIGQMRGNHASKSSSFLYWMISGSCKVELDDGEKKEVYSLNENETLSFSKLVWMRIYNFEAKSILCVLADNVYYSSDYITDYKEFIKMLGANKCIT